MPKKGENIYKRKDGRWEGRYIRYYDTNQKAKFGYVYGKTYSEVKSILAQKKVEVKHNPIITNQTPIIYSDVLDTWLSTTKIRVKESTYAHYSYIIRTHIKPYLGDYQLSRLSTQVIERFVDHLLSNGRLDGNGGLSPKTATDIFAVVKASIEYAQYQNLTVICNFNKLTIKKKDKEMRVLTQNEQKSLVGTLTTEMDLYKFGVLLSLYTGIRIGELCALQWADFDLSASVLKIRKTMQRIQDLGATSGAKTKIVITEPKSKCSIREIPLTPFIAEMALLFQTSPDAFILSGVVHRYVEPRTMQNRFQSYLLDAGVAKANFHTLRHSFATRCIEASFELRSLSEILGHKNVNLTLNRYVHSSMALKQANMNKLVLCI